MKKNLKVAVYHQNYRWLKAEQMYFAHLLFHKNKLERYMQIFNSVITHWNQLNSVWTSAVFQSLFNDTKIYFVYLKQNW